MKNLQLLKLESFSSVSDSLKRNQLRKRITREATLAITNFAT